MSSDSLSNNSFAKKFLVSLAGHAALIALSFTVGEVLNTAFQNKDVEIIQSSVRVDVVGMPKFTITELKKMQAEPVIEKTPEPVKGGKEETVTEADDVIKKDDLVIQEEGKKKASFLNMLNDFSSKKVKAKPQAEKKGSATGTANTKNLDSLILEGNRLSKGSALVGDYTDEQTSEFSAYVQNIPGVIRPYWKLPSYLMDQNLRCRIKIFLSPGGNLLRVQMIESSGNPEFDARAERAAREAKYPKPSEEVGNRLTNSGIILGFPL